MKVFFSVAILGYSEYSYDHIISFSCMEITVTSAQSNGNDRVAPGLLYSRNPVTVVGSSRSAPSALPTMVILLVAVGLFASRGDITKPEKAYANCIAAQPALNTLTLVGGPSGPFSGVMPGVIEFQVGNNPEQLITVDPKHGIFKVSRITQSTQTGYPYVTEKLGSLNGSADQGPISFLSADASRALVNASRACMHLLTPTAA
jgi:hypothetical protein